MGLAGQPLVVACPLAEQGETPSAYVPLALDGAAPALVLSCSMVVTSVSECFVSAWEPGKVRRPEFCLLMSPYLPGHGLVPCSGPGLLC